MGAGAIPLKVERDFLKKARGRYKLNVYIADFSYRGDDRMDVSTNGGYFIFSPPKQLMFDYRLGKMKEGEFKKAYTDFLRESYCRDRHAWDSTLSGERLVLVCGCNAEDTTCHRFGLIDFLKKMGGVYKGNLMKV